MNRVLAFAAVGAVAAWLLYTGVEAQGRRSLSALPTTVTSPSENPGNPDKIALGRLLFWDPVLSGNNDVACATCHHPSNGYAENRDLSIGVNGVGLGRDRQFVQSNTIPIVKRNSQSILNVAFNGIDESGRYSAPEAPMFWDVRVKSLEEQALKPIQSLEEMRGNAYPQDHALDAVVAKLKAIPEYALLFAKAFGASNSMTAANIGKALASFQRTLIATNAPFDRYMRGDTVAMTATQIRGMRRFQRIGCANCHNGPMFSDYKTHVLSVPENRALSEPDRGVENTFAFRTASLRNLAFTAPYMHNGVFRTLDDVVEFYDDLERGRSQNPNVANRQLDRELRRLEVRGRREIVEFLNALSDDSFDRTIPSRVPSGFNPGGRIQPDQGVDPTSGIPRI